VITLDHMMKRMGFDPADTGPYATELRKMVARQMANGMTDRSAGTWAPGDHSAEDRARALLEVEYAIERGHFYEVRNIDGDWSRPASMIGDGWRRTMLRFRVAKDKLLGRRNPYSRAATLSPPTAGE
jgi:hypothetical protein